jgi:hypothetical protein
MMNKRWMWLFLIALLTPMLVFTGCDQLTDDEEATDIDAALVGQWVMYSMSEEGPQSAEYYVGVSMSSDGTGTRVEFTDNGVSDPQIDLISFTWTAVDGILTIETVVPAGEVIEFTYSLGTGNNVLTLVESGTSSQEVFVKYAANHDASVVGTWLVETPTEDAGAIISLDASGSGTYTEPGDDSPDTFTWGTNSGYIGILVYNDLAGFVASYTVSAEEMTLNFSDGSMTLSKITGGGGGGTVDDRMVGQWLLYDISGDIAPEEGNDYYVSLTLRDDGTGSHFGVTEDYDAEEIITESIAFTYEADGDSVTISFINPPQDMPSSMKLGYEFLENDNKMLIKGSDGAGSVETYVRFVNQQDSALEGTWYIASPADELGARIDLNSDGTGTYTNPDGEVDGTFTWGTNAGYIGILMYEPAGMVAAYTVDGDDLSLELPFGTMLLTRTEIDPGGTIDGALVGDYVLYSFEYSGDMPGKTSRSTVKGPMAEVNSLSEVEYPEGVGMSLHDDGTGAYYMGYYEYDSQQMMVEEVTFTWGVVAEGAFRITFDEDGEWGTGGESVVFEHELMDDRLMFSGGDDVDWFVETYFLVADNRPTSYVGTYLFHKTITEPDLGYSMDGMKATLVLNAQDGVVYRNEMHWDDVNQEEYWIDVEESFVWNIDVSGSYFVRYDPVNHIGQVVEFYYDDISQLLEVYMQRWVWDEENQSETLVDMTMQYYLYAGSNNTSLEGMWAPAVVYDGDGFEHPAPRFTLNIDPVSGEGWVEEERWDDVNQEPYIDQSSFDWYNTSEVLLTLDHNDSPDDPPYGQVIEYYLDGPALELWVPMGPEMPNTSILFVRNDTNIDYDILGEWQAAELYVNDNPEEFDSTETVSFDEFNSGVHTGKDQDGNVRTEYFSYGTQTYDGANYLIIDNEEPTGEPENHLLDVIRYEYEASPNETLNIFMFERDEYGNEAEIHMIFTRPAP